MRAENCTETHIAATERKTAIEPILVSRKDAAAALAISVRSLDYLTEAGRLPIRRIGGRRLIAVADLRKFASSDRREPILESVPA